MSESKAPDFDTYGLLRATHSHVSAPLRSVLDMCHWHIAPYPIFAYRGIIIPLALFFIANIHSEIKIHISVSTFSFSFNPDHCIALFFQHSLLIAAHTGN